MRSKGHSITEYAIIGFLVVLVAIPALGTLGGQIDALLNGSGQELSQADALFSLLSGGGDGANGGAAAAANGPGEGPGDPMMTEDSALSHAADSSGLSVMSSGLMATSINGKQDLAKAVSEAGASGVAASRLEAFSDEIDSRLANGEITAEQAGLLRELSNQGYRIAAIEKIAEDAKSFHEPITFEGRTYSNLHEFSKLIGYQNVYPGTVLSNKVLDPSYGNAGPELRKFLEAYQQVDRNIADPELAVWVAGLSTEIALLTEMVEDGAYNKGINPGLDLKAFSASKITDLNSEAFCAAGQGKGTAICN